MTTWLDRRQQKNCAEVHYWSVECWQKFAENIIIIIIIIIVVVIANADYAYLYFTKFIL